MYLCIVDRHPRKASFEGASLRFVVLCSFGAAELRAY